MTADVSRSFADRDKLFRTVVRQQGRLPTDAEENHAAELREWGHDAEFAETITPLGTPNDGFKVVVPTGVDDGFDILAGSYYLGGDRVEIPERLAYADQIDGNWLTQDEPVTDGSRVLVWLEVEERVVTGVQDAELLEPALRGADGSGRTRLCWRVRQAPTAANDCDEALAEVLTSQVFDELDPITGAIASTGTMTIDFDKDDIDLDLCQPAVEPGYLGNRNNCYRIKRTRPGFFVWGEDNAAQLYRVTAYTDTAGGQKIRFLTEPRDEYLRPRPGQTVELLRGDVLLPNYERIAELDGDFFRVTGGYQDSSITLGSDVDPAWLTWLSTSPLDPLSPEGTVRHLYLRVWTGGGAGADPDVPFTAGTARTLIGTGLTVAFNGVTLPGDSWIVSARPDAPTRVLPWALRDGMRSHEPRRHVTALAIVNLATGDVRDCRQRFRPLHKVPTCCTVTVGPPGTRGGDVDSIADALALLPPDGGTICLLAGEHRANVVVKGRRNLRFTGCPGKTTWLPEDPGEPLVMVVDTVGIAFSDITFRSGAAPAIVSGRSDPSDDTAPHGGLLAADCAFIAPAGCAVLARSMAGATLLRCHVWAGPFPQAAVQSDFESLPGVFLHGKDLVVERCEIRARREPQIAPDRLALGGVQIGGGSRRVTIRDCLIRDGAGIGITLGSVTFVKIKASVAEHAFTGQTTTEPTVAEQKAAEEKAAEEKARIPGEQGPEAALVAAVAAHAASDAGSTKNGWHKMQRGFKHTTGDSGCIDVEPVDPGPRDPADDSVEVPVSDGMIEDVEILHNRVHEMGCSGIATYPLALVPNDPIGDPIAIKRLLVADNQITDCVRFMVNMPNKQLRSFFPVGGIALAMALDCVFRGNEILRNGSDFGGGTCGIGIVYGEDILVADNRIEDNGRYDSTNAATGPNAGVHVSMASAGIGRKGARAMPLTDNRAKAGGARAMPGSDAPALAAHGNIISQPAGRALRALALGPVMVNDNRLVGGNPSRLFTELLQAATQVTYAKGIRTSGSGFDLGRIEIIFDLLGGDAVNLVNVSVSSDLLLYLSGAALAGRGPAEGFARIASLSATSLLALAGAAASRFRVGGPTMFHDNQVALHRPLPDGPPVTLSSIFIVSFDDVGFADNQFGIDPDMGLAVTDAALAGVAVRTTGNRGQEAVLTILSMASFALWNTAALNQTTRPILAAGLIDSRIDLNLHL